MQASDDFPCQLRQWMDEHEAVLAGILALHELADAQEAIEAVHSIPELRGLRLALEVWETTVEEGGTDSQALLLEEISGRELRRLRSALLGPGWERRAHLRVTVR